MKTSDFNFEVPSAELAAADCWKAENKTQTAHQAAHNPISKLITRIALHRRQAETRTTEERLGMAYLVRAAAEGTCPPIDD